ncbi:MAG: site-2 protease family protein [Candidatus Thermoplasmatota archaeon]|nr:site-2 protease family protein [Candidatus Thermoplasmatota archaeon]MBU1941300.1 site-2 protease family protein [Candidatus Thermoplasmatota archaeon]
MPNPKNSFSHTSEKSYDIDVLKSEVGQRFPFYEVREVAGTVAFFCRIDKERLEENFDALRRSLAEKGYIPMLRFEKGEHIIYVLPKQKRKERSVWVNIGLMAATVVTATLTGSILHLGFFDLWALSNVMDVLIPEHLIFGFLLFAFPLLSILFIHEMGHYFISRYHGIAASLPFFMPIPPIVPNFNIGTFGALISSRDPMPNKKALFDVGIAGPLAGFIVAVPVTVIGIATSNIVSLSEISAGEPILGTSLLFLLISEVVLKVPVGFGIDLSLLAFAGWVGLLITSINLLPAGQLDGGHIFRAFLGEKQKYAGWLAVFFMIFTGWIFFALIIVFLMGMSHPPPLNDAVSLDLKRKILFFVAVLILIVCFIPYPIMIM